MARRLKLNEIQEGDVVDLAHDGRGVARVDGKAVFIEGALPGERVRFRVFKSRRQMDEAGLVDVLTASPDRVVPRCAHFGVCGGCALQHLAPAAQLAAKQRQLLENLQRIGRLQPATVIAPLAGPVWAYRRRARLGIKYVHKKGRVLAGFRERDKPYVADVRRCEILVGRFAALPEQLAALVETMTLREDIPQVEVAAGDSQAALVFRVMRALGADDVARLEAFGAAHDVQIFVQSGGLDTVTPLRQDYPPLAYGLADGHAQAGVRAGGFRAGERCHQRVHGGRGGRLPRPHGRRFGAGSVLRTGQFHPAPGRAGAHRGGRRGRCGPGGQGTGERAAQQHGQRRLPSGQSLRAGRLRGLGQKDL